MSLARQLSAAAAALAVLGFSAAPAAGQGGIYNDFQGDGTINPCAYSPGQLQNGLNNLPPDLQQYAPGFADQLRAGLEAQCGGGAVPAPGDPDAAVIPGLPGSGGPARPNSTIPKPPAPKPAAAQRLGDVPAPPVSVVPTGSDPPDGLLPLLAAGGALLLIALIGGLRLSGVTGERLTRPLRAAFADAGGRTADALATAWDFVRFGR